MTAVRYRSVFEAFCDNAARHAERPFLHAPASATSSYSNSAITYSWAEAQAQVARIAGAYLALGIGKADRVCLAFDARLDVYLHLLALNALGAGIVPLNSAASDNEIAYVVKHSDSRALAAADEFLPRLQNIAATIPGLKLLGCNAFVDADAYAGGGRGDLATETALLYTSGTTGKPKGCMLSNDYFLSIGEWYNSLGGLCALDSNDRLLTPLPPHHMNALATSFMAMLMAGGCLIQLDRFHPRDWWQTAREEKATVIHCLGVMVAMLLTLPKTAQDSFAGQISFCFGPGSDPRHQAAFEQRFGMPLIEAWAMTETGGGGITIADREPRHVGERCIGKARRGMAFRIVDDNDRDVAQGQPGELLVKREGDNPRAGFFSGYYKDEAATNEGWKGGWWHTGDVVREGVDGSLFFVDRRKNVIRRSGENIAAVEVEAVLQQNPAVSACAVCAVPDEMRGDEVFAFIVPSAPDADQQSLAKDLFDHCLQHLAYFKVPGYFAVIDALPLTASQKISRGEVKALARQCVSSKASVDLRAAKKRPDGSSRARQRNGETARVRLKATKRMSYDGVVVTTPVSIAYERYSHQSAHWWLGRVLQQLGADSGIGSADIDGLCASSFTLHPDTAVGLTQHFGLTPRWLDHVPTGGSSGVVTLRRAARAVQAGDASVVACIAGDTNHVDSFRSMLTSFSRFSQDAAWPYGSGGPNASFALMTQHHMDRYGTRAEDLGKLCVAQRDNALKYPPALMRKPLSLDDYLSARLIADPLRLYDCVMPCAGGEGYLVMREDDAKALRLPFARILSTIERHNAFPEDPIQFRGGWALDKDEFWAMAGMLPAGVDLLQTYDDYPIISAMQFEDLGFCAKGEASEFIQQHSFTHDGTFPHNTSGGQLSVGQAGAAGGFLGLVEAVRQITGAAENNAVPAAKTAAVSGFGMINFDRGLCSAAAILQAGGRD